MSKHSLIGLAAVGLFSVGMTSVAQGQSDRLHLGGRVSYHIDREVAGLGLQFSAPVASHLEFYPSVDNFFVDNGSFWNINADLKYRVPTTSPEWLYVGTGLNIARTGSGENHHSASGLNLFAGIESRRGRVHPFGELRLVAKNGTTAQLVFGLNWTLDRRP